MTSLFKLYLELCLFRAGPQDVPYSQGLMNFTVGAYVLLSLIISLADYSFPSAVVSVAIDLIMMIGFTLTGLWLRQFTHRITQTVTALAGAGIVFNLLSWPLVVLASDYSPDQLLFPQYLLYLLLFWNIGIVGHILKMALSISYWVAIVISVSYIFTYYSVISIFLTPNS